jgi:hypothetical protein
MSRYPMTRASLTIMARTALATAVIVGTAAAARADETAAKKLLKSMTDYVAAQKSISFNYDATLGVMTKDDQRLALLSSGDVVLNRPDKIRFSRAGGFADMEMLFDGKALTLIGKNDNVYIQADAPGTVDQLVNDLQEKFKRPLPAADLLLSNAYDELTSDVIDVKDLGSGVVGGAECDYLAFRKQEVDFQIWIAQGDKPYPCRFTITTRGMPGNPQYSIQVRDWKTGGEVAMADFTFKNSGNARKIDITDIREKFSDLPGNFTTSSVTTGAGK